MRLGSHLTRSKQENLGTLRGLRLYGEIYIYIYICVCVYENSLLKYTEWTQLPNMHILSLSCRTGPGQLGLPVAHFRQAKVTLMSNIRVQCDSKLAHQTNASKAFLSLQKKEECFKHLQKVELAHQSNSIKGQAWTPEQLTLHCMCVYILLGHMVSLDHKT